MELKTKRAGNLVSCCTFLLGDNAKQGEAPLTPPYVLGENTKRGDWDDLGEHHARQKVQAASQWN